MFSCKSAPNPQADFLQWAKKGEIITVTCKSDINNTYQLYLPANYNLEKTWPLIYCFDSHGDGNLPINLLRQFAEREGFILVGSNSSRNGLGADELSFIIEKLYQDTRTKLSIDDQRIYALGFSGGARVACSMALTYQNISGVIACSAGYRPSQGQPAFNFIGIAGTLDMNCQEMKQIDVVLNNFPVRHELILFNGKHQWPSADLLEQAISDLEIMNMANGKIKINESLINVRYEAALSQKISIVGSSNLDSLLMAERIINNAERVFEGVKDISEFKLLNDKLLKSPMFAGAKEKYKKIELQESQKQQVYGNAIREQSLGWWMDEIQKLNKIKFRNTESPESQSAYRLLAYISLLSYSYVNSAIQQHDWASSEHFLKIYGLADPENPDYLYFNACYLAQTGKNKEAYQSLQNAIKYGFNDKVKLERDPLLEGLKKDFDFAMLFKN
jgi:hypothetical protein